MAFIFFSANNSTIFRLELPIPIVCQNELLRRWQKSYYNEKYFLTTFILFCYGLAVLSCYVILLRRESIAKGLLSKVIMKYRKTLLGLSYKLHSFSFCIFKKHVSLLRVAGPPNHQVDIFGVQFALMFLLHVGRP